jgi:hypothetical protein
MAPEGTIVIPEMVVGVAGPATDGEFRLLVHDCVLSVGAHAPRRAENTKAVVVTTASGLQEEHFREPTGFRTSAGRICAGKAP